MNRVWLFFLVSCGPDITIDSRCESLCSVASVTMETCLVQDAQDWENTVYVDKWDYQSSCETWAWELQMLAKRLPNSSEQLDLLGEHCLQSEATLTEATCETFWAFDWDTEPWNLP